VGKALLYFFKRMKSEIGSQKDDGRIAFHFKEHLGDKVSSHGFIVATSLASGT
ncbi:MAG: hypothetical protein RL681_775, partial [Candidatus Parcubacteria bacterium]